MGKGPRPGSGSDGQPVAVVENAKLLRGAARPVLNRIDETKPTATMLDITGAFFLMRTTLNLTRA
jgi:hypothetical protein